MLFLFGESTHIRKMDIGSKSCPVCQAQKAFLEITETTYFNVFGVRLLPIEKTAHYWQCNGCNYAFSQNDIKEPSHLELLRHLLVYLMLGYGVSDQKDSAKEIFVKVTSAILDDEQLRKEIALQDSGDLDIQKYAADVSMTMNFKGKQEVLEGIYLMTYICCDLEYEDRLRINLIANSLGVGISGVEYVIQSVRERNYLAIRRLSGLTKA